MITDRKIPKFNNVNSTFADYYDPVVLSASDYYPFGMEMPGRTIASNVYRFGFNGKEKDTDGEWGTQMHYDYGFRIYEPAIGRWLSVDPLEKKYSDNSPYTYAINSPLSVIDPDGRDIIVTGSKEYRIYVNEQLTLLRMTDGGSELYKQLENSRTKIIIRQPTKADFERVRRVRVESSITISLSHFNMRDNVLTFAMPKNLKLSSSFPLATIGHELYHAYNDVIQNGDKEGLRSKDFVDENIMATAFENYLRDRFDKKSSNRYGYRSNSQRETVWDKKIQKQLSVNDLNNKIVIVKDIYVSTGVPLGAVVDLTNKVNPITILEKSKHVRTEYVSCPSGDCAGAETKTIDVNND